ncbi:hypothetical protein Hanom_Chr12g01076371 [Helianthus anomalus]
MHACLCLKLTCYTSLSLYIVSARAYICRNFVPYHQYRMCIVIEYLYPTVPVSVPIPTKQNWYWYSLLGFLISVFLHCWYQISTIPP